MKAYMMLVALLLAGCSASQQPEVEVLVSGDATIAGMTITEAMHYQAYDVDGNEPSVTAKEAYDVLHATCASSKVAEVCQRRDWLATRLQPWCFFDNRGWGPCHIPALEHNELVAEFRRNPIDAMNKWRGQMLEVRGPISHMEAYTNGAAQAIMGHTFNDGLSNFTVTLLFADGSHLSGINVGERIGVECTVLGYHEQSVVCGIQ